MSLSPKILSKKKPIVLRLFIGLPFILFLFLSVKYDFGETLLKIINSHESWELDEILLTLILCSFAILFFTFTIYLKYIHLSKKKISKELHLNKTIKEKETIIKEAHHRIKNNLFMISGLINMKLANTDNEDLKNFILNISTKINSISLIHDKLYRNIESSNIDLSQYLSSLIYDLDSSLFTKPGKINYESNNNSLLISSKKAIPIGLIISELVTNAVKYGLKNKTDYITIKYEKYDNQNTLTISNTGNPFPLDLSLTESKTLGLKLITALVSQIDGNIELEKEPITKFTISFN